MNTNFDQEARDAEMDEYFWNLQMDLDDGGLSRTSLRKPNRKSSSGIRKFREN